MRVGLGQIVRLMGLALGLWVGLSAGVASAANIAWVSVNADDTGQDQGFVDVLRGAGHTVTRVQRNGTGSTLTPEKIATLNASDLVIVGRAVNSGDFDTAANATFWNTELTKPVMYNSAYLVRRNRLGMSTGDGVPDSQATPLIATNASHPIFSGITFAGDGVTMANPYNTFVDRGTTAMGNLPRNGTVLATNPAVAGGVAIVEWAAGTVVQDEGNIDYVLGGRRYFFAAGSRELDQTAITTAGKFDLTADGQQLFLNTVNYALIPEPSTAAVLMGFGLAMMVRRSRR